MLKQVRFAAASLVIAIGAVSAMGAETGGSANETTAPSRGAEAPRVRDDLSEKLRPHERHVYQRDMADCSTMERVDRQVCQRGVRSKARATLRRRSGH